MGHKEIIDQLKFEYWSYRAAVISDDAAHGTNWSKHIIDFYDYLLGSGYNRFQLSALGISRKNALGDV